ncbi:MAG: LytTR family DNA-binding domain-containing protein [Salinivirgaceae bacterium]|jgi:two-component system LytT family response regulator|nr:LytTR family DNA-binding domain-containing protein [Salinivirgaceae bacterium]
MNKDCNQQEKKITIKERNTFHQCEIVNITHIKCDSYISTIHQTNSKAITVAKLLKKFEQELSEFSFIRANRSTLVNFAHIQKYSMASKMLELTNGEIIPISRRRLNIFREALKLS